MCLGVSFSEMVSCGREDCGWIFVLPRAKVGGQSGIHNSRPNCRALIGHGWTARACCAIRGRRQVTCQAL